MATKKTNNDKANKPRQNSYRHRFTLPDGRRVEYTSHTKAERDSIALHVRRLISSKKTGAPALESEEWALRLPKGILKDSLVRWQLIDNPADTEKTIADLYQIFVVDGKRKERTITNRKAAADRLSAFFGSGCLLRDISREQAGNFINDLETKGNLQTGKGLGENTVVSIVKRCKLFFKYALEMGWITENPFSRFTTTYKPNPDRWQYVTKEDTLNAIEYTTNREHRLIIALVRFCGLRGASELSRLTFDASCFHPSDANHEAELLVPNTKVERHAKHSKPRPIPLIPEVEQLILDLWERIPEGENRFFPRMKATSNPGIIVKRKFKRIGIDIGQMYNLRRSFVSDLMAKGMHETDPKMFELLAGHDIVMSLTNYQIVSESRKENATKKFMEIMSAPPISPPPAPTFAPCNYPQADEASGEENAQTLENKGFSQKESPSCNLMQQGLIPPRGIERSSKDPRKQGIFQLSDNSRPHFCPHQNFVKQIADLFDRLTVDEKEQVLKLLTARTHTADGVMQN